MNFLARAVVWSLILIGMLCAVYGTSYKGFGFMQFWVPFGVIGGLVNAWISGMKFGKIQS